MPSTYSTDLKLELMATGEDNNIWGDTTNTNLGTLLEQSIVRSGAVAIADANTTISISNGATSAARCFVLALSGALTAQRNLVVPTINKPYIVYNNTTGGFGVQVKTTAGTGIVVPNGKRRFLYADGTNVVEMIDSLAALTVAGTAITINGFTITPAGNITTAAALTTAGSALTLTTTAPTNVTLPVTGTLATLAGSETFTNKTLTLPVIASISNSGTVTLPTGAETLVGRATTDTLTNKTLTNDVANTQSAGDNSTKLATTAYVDTAVGAGVPAGVIWSYGGSAAPTGFVLCDGSSLLRASFAALFTAIGTAYGAADGTHFNVPDLRGRVPAGKDNMGGSAASRLTSTTMTPDGTTLAATGGEQTHLLTTAEMPSHAHTLSPNALSSTGGASFIGGAGVGDPLAGTQNTGGGGVHNNVQPSLIVNYIIKT